jgi:hypothetical protein
MARPESLRAFLITPPEEEPIFRFGASLLGDQASVWLDGADLVWMRQMSRRSLDLRHIRSLSAHVAVLAGQAVRHLAITPYALEEGLPIAPGLTFQDRHGALFDRPEPDFEPFAAHFLARLRLYRPFLRLEGDETVLLPAKGC